MVTPSCYTSERHQHGGRKLCMLPRKLVDRCLKQCETRRSQVDGLNAVENKVFTKQRRKPYLFSFFYVRLLRTGRFHFEKKMKYFVFSKEHRGAYFCPTFTEGGAYPRNTVLIAFEGFNLISIFFYQFVLHLRASLHLWSSITFVASTHIYYTLL